MFSLGKVPPVKLRSSLILLSTVGGLVLGTLVPAQAAPTDPITDLEVSVVQASGANDAWRVSASWTANPDATTYSVLIADHADGSVTPGKFYGNEDTVATSADLDADNLVAGHTYWIAVQPIAPATGTVTTAEFTPPELDTEAPNGTYQLSATTAFLKYANVFEDDGGGTATVTVTQTSIAPGTVTRTVVLGDGTAAKAWTTSKPFLLQYTRAGKFTPKVRLVDEFGNLREIALPTVWVRADTIAPTIKITRPAKPGKVASWRVIRGTASDVGNGLEMIGTFVIEKRGAIWWSYDFRKKKWLKGYTTIRKTINKSKANPAYMSPTASGAWRSPAIKGLTKGTLHVEAVAIDQDFNGRLVKINQKIG